MTDDGENVEIYLPLLAPNFHHFPLQVIGNVSNIQQYLLFTYKHIILIYYISVLVIFVTTVVCSRRIAFKLARREARGQERHDIYL